jgi:hypothetical protein
LPQPLPHRDPNYRQRTKEGKIVMATARRRRVRWRTAKSSRKLQKRAKGSGRWRMNLMEQDDEQPDRLLLSALRYWEVERDLIEERLAVTKSAAAAS